MLDARTPRPGSPATTSPRSRPDRRRPGRRPGRADPAVGRRGAPLPARRARRAASGELPDLRVPRAVRAAGAGAPGRRRRRARRPAVDLPGAQRPRQPAGPGPAGARAAPRRRRRGGDRAQPGLDGRRPRGLQGRRRVPAHRAALPGRPHRHHARPRRVPARADRARQHRHARPGPRRRCPGSRRCFVDAAYDGGPRRRRPRRRRRRRTSSPTSTSPPAPPASPRARCASTPGMLNHLYAKIDDLEIGEGQVVAQTAPQCFDISLWQLLSALLVGGRTAARRAGGDPGRRSGSSTRSPTAGSTVLQVVPSYLDVVLSYLEQHPRDAAGPALRVGHRRGAEEGARPALVRRRSPASGWSTPTG